jgi:heme-degrading monooxygenase HmoA
MGDDVFRVLLRMRIHPGLEGGFEETWAKVGTAVTGHPANLGQWLSRSAEEPGVYYVMSDWVNEREFRAFESSDAHLAHREKLHPFRSGGEMTTMRVRYAFAGAGSPAS